MAVSWPISYINFTLNARITCFPKRDYLGLCRTCPLLIHSLLGLWCISLSLPHPNPLCWHSTYAPKCIWSIHAFPYSNSTPLYSHNLHSIAPISCRSFPKMILRLFFGTHTMWYLHSHTVCAKLLFTFNSFLTDRPPKQPNGHPKKGVSLFQILQRSFCYSPQRSRGG